MSLIVVGVDGSEQSRRAFDWAVTYAADRSAVVQAITTVETKDLADDERQARLVAAERMVARLVTDATQDVPSPPRITYDVVEGDPSIVLVDASRGADLIVLGSHGMSSLRNPALGSVSLACIRMGSCPVLVIPAGIPERIEGADLLVR